LIYTHCGLPVGSRPRSNKKSTKKNEVYEKAWVSPKLLQMKPAPWDFFRLDNTMQRCRCLCLQSTGCWRCCHLWPWFMYLSYWISNAHTDTPLTHTLAGRQGASCIKNASQQAYWIYLPFISFPWLFGWQKITALEQKQKEKRKDLDLVHF